MKKRIIIRIDDVGIAFSGKRRDTGMRFYERMHMMFIERGIYHCPCVIPASCGPAEFDWMRENMSSNPFVSAFIHGWDHEESGKGYYANEFGELSKEEKKSRVNLACRYMIDIGGVKVVGMSAPFNRYDDDVLKECFDSGIRYFLAGYGREKPEPFEERFGLWIVPCNEGLYKRTGDKGEVKCVVERLEPRKTPYVLTLHTTWESLQIEDGTLERLLDAVAPFSYDIRNIETDFGKGGE